MKKQSTFRYECFRTANKGRLAVVKGEADEGSSCSFLLSLQFPTEPVNIRLLQLQWCLEKFGGCLKLHQLVTVLEGLPVNGECWNAIYSASFTGFQGPDGRGHSYDLHPLRKLPFSFQESCERYRELFWLLEFVLQNSLVFVCEPKMDGDKRHVKAEGEQFDLFLMISLGTPSTQILHKDMLCHNCLL